MGFWLRWGGILLGAISLFSLVQKLYGFGLAPVLKDILSFYRALFHPVIITILDIFRSIGLPVPEISPDYVIIFFLFLGGRVRAIDVPLNKLKWWFWPALILGSCFMAWSFYLIETETVHDNLFSLIVIYLFFSYVSIIFVAITKTTGNFTRREVTNNAAEFQFEVIKVVFAALILFGTNAYFSY